jgi:FkbM family methyltransferase
MNPLIRSRIHRARRLAQTPRAFVNWPQLLTGMALGRVGRGPDTLRFRTRAGLVIDTPNRPGARVPVYEIFAEDCYRFAWFLGPLLSRPIQVIDIGGHVGTFSCRLSQLHAGARVQAFEPSATTAAFLRGNVLRNGFGDRVSVHEVALAATTGFAVFDDNGAGSGLNGLAAAGHAAGTATKVETVAFDDIIATTNAPVDLVKIDCEGGEYDLVLGSSRDSWANVQRVVIEWHPVDGHEWAELRDWFATVGLQVQDEDAFGRHGCVWLSREPLPPFAT